MNSVSRVEIEAALAKYSDPYIKQDLLAAKAVKNIEINAKGIKIDIVVGFPLQGIQEKMLQKLKDLLIPVIGKVDLQMTIRSEIESHVGQQGLKGLPQVKNIIAVASGKGGVGKSTTAVNLALALMQEGARAGILDADIYGPSQPLMLGVTESPELKDKKTLLPIMAHGIQSMSIGYLVGETSAMVWRGPMVSMALQQLLHDTQWDNLDYLIIDLPPGTGDIQLTLAQKIPVSAAVIVTTPQDLALLDARRAYEMFRKVRVPVLGVIENMSVHICTQCGHQERIFGEGGGQHLAEQYDVELLGALPLDIRIREETDGGKPTVIAEPNGPNATLYREIARRMAAKLSLQTKDYSSKFPTITIKND